MADESKSGASGSTEASGGQPAAGRPSFLNRAEQQSGEGTTDSDQPKSEGKVSENESKALDGNAGPGLTPSFAKHQGQDENNRVADPAILASNKDGADAQSAGSVAAQDIEGLIQAQAVGSEAPEGDANVQYTSRIAALRIGRFQFNGGVLTVSSEDGEKFEKLVAQTSPRTQNSIRKIERGQGVVANRLNLGSRSTRGFDTSGNGPKSPAPSVS